MPLTAPGTETIPVWLRTSWGGLRVLSSYSKLSSPSVHLLVIHTTTAVMTLLWATECSPVYFSLWQAGPAIKQVWRNTDMPVTYFFNPLWGEM
jgi:hypothetical protein